MLERQVGRRRHLSLSLWVLPLSVHLHQSALSAGQSIAGRETTNSLAGDSCERRLGERERGDSPEASRRRKQQKDKDCQALQEKEGKKEEQTECLSLED